MRQITEISNSAAQRLILVGEENERIEFTLTYKPTQQSWFYDINYQGVIIRGRKLSLSPNIVFQWKNRVPFGIACVSDDGGEPFFIDDFISGRVRLILLNEEERDAVAVASQGAS